MRARRYSSTHSLPQHSKTMSDQLHRHPLMKLGENQSWSGTLWKNKLLFVELKFSALATNLTIVPLCSHNTMNTLS